MRTSIFVRAGALLTAAAMTIALGTGPASAADSSQTRAVEPVADNTLSNWSSVGRTASGKMGIQATGETTISSITMKSGYLWRAGLENGFAGVVVATGDNTNAIDVVTADVVDTNGTVKGVAEVYPDGAYIPSTSGAGVRRLTNVTIHYTLESGLAPTVAATASNYFYARRYIQAGKPVLKFTWSGKKKSFYVRGVKIFVPATGTYKTLGSIKLQYLKSGKWRTKKTIKLSSAGNGSYKFKTKKKYRYRIYSPVTSTSGGLYTKQSSKH